MTLNLPLQRETDCSFLAGGGITGELIGSIDWSKTPLGPISSWSTSLKCIVGTILHARHPMFLWWGKGLVQFYNDAYLPSFGVGKHPTAMGQLGKECWQENWHIIGPQIDDVMSHGKPSWSEDAVVPFFRNGRLEDAYWTYGCSPVFDDDGGIGGTLVVCTETTSRFVAEQGLREALESLETTLHSIGDAVVATNALGVIVRMNPIAERLTGWNFSDTKSKSITEVLRFISEDTRAHVANPLEQTLREGITVKLAEHSLLVRRDGTEIPIGDSCAPIKSGDGMIHGAVLVFRDLTAQRGADALQEKLQNQLIVSDRMASMGTLAAGVAHEINNPLTYVTANVEIAIQELHALAGGSASAQIKDLEELLLEASEGAARIKKIVRGLKTFSRVDDERRSVIDLVPVLELAIDMTFNEIRHRAKLVKNYGEIPRVLADDARLGQVFINLLINAVQAIPEGKADCYEIRIVTSTDSKGRAVVEVGDTGPGIPAEVLGRIFDPFFTTKAVGVGTGLGLAICHSIVTAMGGEIFAHSEVNRGTTFRVVLPAYIAGDSLECPIPSPAEVSPLRTGQVLVVDDELSIGLAIKRILRGHDVTVVTSGQDALNTLASGKTFDVILSDLMMPEMSGMDLYAALSRQYPHMTSRVVFITGGVFSLAVNVFLDETKNEQLEKPLDFKKLRETVQRFVRLNPKGKSELTPSPTL